MYASQKQQSSDYYLRVNRIDTVFSGIVDGKHDTSADLKALGLPQEWAKYAGTSFWSHHKQIADDPKYSRYTDKFTTSNILRYYVEHPVRTMEILQQRGQNLLGMRPDYLGSYTPSTQMPKRAQENRIVLVSGMGKMINRAGLFVLVPIWGSAEWVGVRLFHRNGSPSASDAGDHAVLPGLHRALAILGRGDPRSHRERKHDSRADSPGHDACSDR